MTIAMDDKLLNGTNRVVLDGVMTEKECERIVHLANVSFRARGGRKAAAGSLTRSLTSRLVSDRPRGPPATATEVGDLRTRPTRCSRA